MPRSFLIALTVCLSTLTTALVAEQTSQIVTQGHADIAAVPDMARISIGVTHQAATATDAINAMSADSAAIAAKLIDAGLADKDIQTSSLRLDLQRDYDNKTGTSTVVGYVAATQINIVIYDLDKIGEILGQVVSDGANQINGLSFDVADRAPHLEAARRAAVADARAKAAVYADAAGVTLGALMSITEGGGNAGPVPMQGRMEMAVSNVPIAAGEIEISASVVLTFAIKP